MHLHPRAALPLVQLQRPSTGRHPEMPMTTSSAASELALAPNDKTTTAAFLSWRARSGTGRSARSRRVRSDRVPSTVAGPRRGRRCSSSCVASSSAPSLPVWREPRTCTGSARRSLFSDAGVRELPEQAARPVLMYTRARDETEVAALADEGSRAFYGGTPRVEWVKHTPRTERAVFMASSESVGLRLRAGGFGDLPVRFSSLAKRARLLPPSA
jgi:hypothetical protein